jgi:hypothetical protein
MVDLERFLQNNFEFYQRPEHWFRQAVDLHETALNLSLSLRAWAEHYEAALRAAHLSLETSEHETAEVECEEPNLLPAYLLHGYAIENAFKAVLIYREPSLIRPKDLAKKIRTHDLVKLADHAGITLTVEEAGFLQWLSEVILWKGRYNVPIEARKLGHFYALDHLAGETLVENLKIIDAIFGRAAQLLPADATRRVQGFNVVVRVPPDET